MNELGGRDYVTGRMLAVAADSPAVADTFGLSQDEGRCRQTALDVC